MYRCEMCGQSSEPGAPIIRRVVATRERDYPQREQKTRKGTIRDPGGYGTETVKEAALCSECALRVTYGEPFKAWKPEPRTFGALTPKKPRKARKPAPEPPAPESLSTLRIDPRV